MQGTDTRSLEGLEVNVDGHVDCLDYQNTSVARLLFCFLSTMNPLMMTATKGDLQLPDLTEGMSRRQGSKVLDHTQSETSPSFNRQQR